MATTRRFRVQSSHGHHVDVVTQMQSAREVYAQVKKDGGVGDDRLWLSAASVTAIFDLELVDPVQIEAEPASNRYRQ